MAFKKGFLLIEIVSIMAIVLTVSIIMAHVATKTKTMSYEIQCSMNALTAAAMVTETNSSVIPAQKNREYTVFVSDIPVLIPDLPLEKPFLARKITVTCKKHTISKTVSLMVGPLYAKT